MAQGHGFAGNRQLVFHPGPGEAQQGLAHGYLAQVGGPGEDGDVAGLTGHPVAFRHQVQAGQQAYQGRAQAEVFVAEFSGFPGGVQPGVPVQDFVRIFTGPRGLQARKQRQFAAGQAVFQDAFEPFAELFFIGDPAQFEGAFQALGPGEGADGQGGADQLHQAQQGHVVDGG